MKHQVRFAAGCPKLNFTWYELRADAVRRSDEVCPLCGRYAQRLFTSVSCPNPACRNWDRKQFPEVTTAGPGCWTEQ